MDNIKELQRELLNQKEVIESKSGYVVVKNLNPSPSEITEAIKTIPSTDLSLADATEEDVARGKKFYSGNSIIKTGTASINPNEVNAVFMSNIDEQSSDEQFYWTFANGLKQTRKYNFYRNLNKVQITFNPDIELIEEYTFYNAKNFSFKGLSELENLTKIATYAFAYSGGEGLDFSNLPDSITYLGSFCFFGVEAEGLDYAFPKNLTYIGQSAFRREKRAVVNNLDLTNFTLERLPEYLLFYLAFNCDLIVPDCVKTMGSYFNHCGSFNNIVLPPTITSLEAYCFGARVNEPISNFYLKTITFEGETVPNFGIYSIAPQHISNGVKIYVPDNVIEEYKAKANFSEYANNIYPISQKE